jgi:two-component system chemotaxis sensor kinase CheA
MTQVEAVAHRLESVFQGVRNGTLALEPGGFDVLYAGVDAIGALVPAAADGRQPGVDVDAVIAALERLASGAPDPHAPAAPDPHPPAAGAPEPHAPVVGAPEREGNPGTEPVGPVVHNPRPPRRTPNPSRRLPNPPRRAPNPARRAPNPFPSRGRRRPSRWGVRRRSEWPSPSWTR